VTAEDRTHLIHFANNDIASLEAAGDDLASMMVSVFKHDIGLDLELPTPAFAQRVRAPQRGGPLRSRRCPRCSGRARRNDSTRWRLEHVLGVPGQELRCG